MCCSGVIAPENRIHFTVVIEDKNILNLFLSQENIPDIITDIIIPLRCTVQCIIDLVYIIIELIGSNRTNALAFFDGEIGEQFPLLAVRDLRHLEIIISYLNLIFDLQRLDQPVFKIGKTESAHSGKVDNIVTEQNRNTVKEHREDNESGY